ncbi:MAG: hypothetical protein JWM10_3328 [Myxococcaceae bacterium]|nr:hypothetical protein [Myxococcaceae bacterium]
MDRSGADPETAQTAQTAGTERPAAPAPGVVRAPSLRRSLIRNLTRALLDFEEAGDVKAARIVLTSLNRVFGLEEEDARGGRTRDDVDDAEGAT